MTNSFEDLWEDTKGYAFFLVSKYCQAGYVGFVSSEEMIHEAMVAVWESTLSYDETRGHATTWAVLAIRNKMKQLCFPKYRARLVDIDSVPLYPSLTSKIDFQRELILADLVKHLTPRCRDVIHQRFYEGKSIKEIGERNAVWRAENRAIHQLRSMWKGETMNKQYKNGDKACCGGKAPSNTMTTRKEVSKGTIKNAVGLKPTSQGPAQIHGAVTGPKP